MMLATKTVRLPCSGLPVRAMRAASRRVQGLNKMVVKAENAPQEPTTSAPEELPTVTFTNVEQAASPAPAAAAATATVADTEVYSVFGPIQETINGRAAMLGFAIAVLAENLSNQSVFSQVAGKMVNEEYVERAIAASDLSFGFVVALVSLATFAPLVFNGEKPGSRSFGPFTAGAEKLLGRAAMIGFAGLVLVELAKGNTALF